MLQLDIGIVILKILLIILMDMRIDVNWTRAILRLDKLIVCEAIIHHSSFIYNSSLYDSNS